MKKINWNDKFKTGIEEADLQHEYFALLVNRLIDEFKESNDSEYKNRLLEELAQYTAFHFISEANLMIKNNYPDVKEHMAIHRKLLSQLNDMINYYKLSKEKEETIIEFLIDWFVHHTLEDDREFGLFIALK